MKKVQKYDFEGSFSERERERERELCCVVERYVSTLIKVSVN